MLIRKMRGWEIPERLATPEPLVLNRRHLMRGAGALAAAAALGACSRQQQAKNAGAGEADPTASLYPFKANPNYQVTDRAITSQDIVTSYNNYYEFGVEKDDPVNNAFRLPIRPWEISFEGMVEKEFKTDIDTLIKAMPREERVYRHRCVETWAFVAPWDGFAMKELIAYAKPTSAAKYVVMKSWMDPEVAPAQNQPWVPWPYTEGLTIAEATNDLAFLTIGAYGKPLAKQNGAPIRLSTPWKYGFKSSKGMQRFIFTDKRPTTYWMALGPSEYGFWANVNPQVPHPRWSQATEEILGTGERVPTVIYNGYGEQVASLYANLVGERLFM
jgi:methionine sulfoxide reductase catalytic subunit